MSDDGPDTKPVPRPSLERAGRSAERGLDRVFLRRSGYRQRRLRDGLRMLPLAGAVLWFIPVFWTGSASGSVSNGAALVYIFAVWILLIGLVFSLSRFVRMDDSELDADTASPTTEAAQDPKSEPP